MIGSHFSGAIKQREWPVYGIARNSASSRIAAQPNPEIFRLDILDRDALDATFEKINPDLVIHMAAQAFNSISWKNEESTHLNNYQGTVNVLRASQKYVPDAKVLIACSSAEYGDMQAADCPLTENRLLQPITPYGVSKVATECLGYQYFKNFSLKVFLPRLFIHVGTGHPPATAIQNFARQLALISKGRAEPVVKVGNLDSTRDFIDVRDGVDAMMLMIEKADPGDPMNICTGEAYKISDILNMLVEISGLKVEIVKDTSLLRPSDEPVLIGDNSKLTALGWQQKYSIRQTLQAVYEDWCSRI